MREKVKIAICDSCLFSRFALEGIINELMPDISIVIYPDLVSLFFQNDEGVSLIITSSVDYECLKINEFEVINNQLNAGVVYSFIVLTEKKTTNLTLLSYFFKGSEISLISKHENLDTLERLIYQVCCCHFVGCKTSSVTPSHLPKLTKNEVRALYVILNGGNLANWAAIYKVSYKTLHSQKDFALKKLGIQRPGNIFLYNKNLIAYLLRNYNNPIVRR